MSKFTLIEKPKLLGTAYVLDDLNRLLKGYSAGLPFKKPLKIYIEVQYPHGEDSEIVLKEVKPFKRLKKA